MEQRVWTIELICTTLGNQELEKCFMHEIKTAPAHTLLTVFAKWEARAKDIEVAVARGRELAQYDERGEPLPGEWIDVTDRVLAEAEAAQERRA